MLNRKRIATALAFLTLATCLVACNNKAQEKKPPKRVVVVKKTLAPSATVPPTQDQTQQPTQPAVSTDPTGGVTTGPDGGVTTTTSVSKPTNTNTSETKPKPATPTPSKPSAEGDLWSVKTSDIKPYIAKLSYDKQRYTNYWSVYGGTDPFMFCYQVDTLLTQLNPNSFDFWISWAVCEAEKGKYNFDNYDIAIDKVASIGCKVDMRINCMDMPKWFLNTIGSDGMCKYTMRVRWSGAEEQIVSYANEEGRSYVLKYVKALAKHYKDRYAKWPGGSPINFYSTCFSRSGEMEYDFDETDYSPAAAEAFRRWLERKYATTAILSEAWGENVSSFNSINCPGLSDNGSATRKVMDWLEYRAYEHGRIIDDIAKTVKSQDPNAKVNMVFGSIYDVSIKSRGTLFADYWVDSVDWIGVADALDYDHKFHMSLVRGISKGRNFYNEAFKEKDKWHQMDKTDEQLNKYYNEEWLQMTKDSFEEGANQMNYAGFPINDIKIPVWDYYWTGVNFLKTNGQAVTRPNPKRAIYMSTWSLTRDYNSVQNEAVSKFYQLRSSGAVDIIRDGTFENDYKYLDKYDEIIFLDANQYVSDSARAALAKAKKEFGITFTNAPSSDKDKYGNARMGFTNFSSDNTKPVVKGAAAKGYISGIASDVGSGVSKVVVKMNGKEYTADGTDSWTISTSGKSGTAEVKAYDNKGNISSVVNITIK